MKDDDRLTLTIPEVARLLGISRNLAYDLANQGKIPVLRLSQRRLVVPRDALQQMLTEAGKPKD